jgi:hypothetical protein
MGTAMASEYPRNGLPANLRFLLLAFGAAIAAGVLYVLFPFLPDALQVFITLAACLIAMHGGSKPNDEKTLASLLCAYIAVLLVLARVCIYFHRQVGI